MNSKNLPDIPNDKRGWPWAPVSDRAENEWNPRVSIVTPSYNQGEFIEETIRSVLLQDYSNIQYLIIDGGSTDKTTQVLDKYRDHVDLLVSEKDEGQADAINKGFSHADGSLFAWLNSDDFLCPGAVSKVVQRLRFAPDAAMFVGSTQEIDRTGNPLRLLVPRIADKSHIGNWGTGNDADCHFHQPSVFFSAEHYRACGGVNTRHHVAMDVELWMKLSRLGEITVVDDVLSCARIYPEAKTFNDIERVFVEMIALNFNQENLDIAKHYLYRYISYVEWKKKQDGA